MAAHGEAFSLDLLRRQFLDPDDEFSPFPFWFWNGDLEKAEIVRQIRDFRAKGVAGFIIHPRMGLAESIPYLSDAYFDFVETAVIEAERLGMKVMLYDEAMYPSGSAMGMVVKQNPAYASRGLRMAELPCSGRDECVFAVPLEEGDRLLSVQAVRKRTDGSVDLQSVVWLDVSNGKAAFEPPSGEVWSVLFFIETFSKGTIRGVYEGQDDGQPGAPPSADLLNPEATEAFIRITHEAYYVRLKRYFGSPIIAMFTDEPNILGRHSRKGLKPWTEGFLRYAGRFGLREEQLAALWLDAGSGTEKIRNVYRKAVNAKLGESYYAPLSAWCERHGISLTGHPAESGDIGLLDFFQIPGQDVVWRYVEPGKSVTGPHSVLGKCASDAARHRGRRRNLNECFGACYRDGAGWHFPADDLKWYMDWLFVRGVNLLVPHAFYYSISGPRKHERPPDVGPHSIWWPHYHLISGYMRRMSWLMTDSVQIAQIALLCEEDWLPWEAAVPLYENQIGFHYLEEDLFVAACEISGGEARIADCSYSLILVEDSGRFKEQTIEKLGTFASAGGTVIFLREPPAGVPGLTANSAADLPALIKSRLPRLMLQLDPAAPEIRVSALQKGNAAFFLFVNEGEEPWSGVAKLAVSGRIEKWDAWEARTSVQPALEAGEGYVRLPVALERRESALYCVDPSRPPDVEGRFPVQRLVKSIPLDKGWRIKWLTAVTAGTEGGASQTEYEPAELGSWTDWSGMEHVSGTMEYINEFTLEPADLGRNRTIRIELGDVGEMAETELNGHPLGVRFWKPYRYADVSGAAKEGLNRIRIRVTNSLANAYNGVSLPSGLLGPAAVEIWEEV
jgi:hypothetical protein